jgi:hypothetical protein
MIYLMFEPDSNQYRKALHVFYLYGASISWVNQQGKIKIKLQNNEAWEKKT